MTDADRKAIKFANEVIERQRPLWEQVAKDLGIDIDTKPIPGSFEEKLCLMSPEEFLQGTSRMQERLEEIRRMRMRV